MASPVLIKPPMSFPSGPSEVNAPDSRDFAKQRHLGLFWMEDLCGKPFEKNEHVGVWVRFPRNSRQAIAIDLESCQALETCVKRSTLSLHTLISWFNVDRKTATSVLEKVLKPQCFSHLRILLSVLTEDRNLPHTLLNEYKKRKEHRHTAHDGWSVEDDEREERYQVDVWSETGSRTSWHAARGVNHSDQELAFAAAERLHEHWRSTVPKLPVWTHLRANSSFSEWYDPRFHEMMVRNRLGKWVVNVNSPFHMLPPSCGTELLAVARDVLDTVRHPQEAIEESETMGGDFVDGVAEVMHKNWVNRRREELRSHKLEQDDEAAKRAAEKDHNRLVLESIVSISKNSRFSGRSSILSRSGSVSPHSSFSHSPPPSSSSSSGSLLMPQRQSVDIRPSFAQQAQRHPVSTGRAVRRTTAEAEDAPRGRGGGSRAGGGVVDETTSALYAVQDAAAHRPLKWSPLVELPMLDQKVVEALHESASEDDRQVVAICLDAFQSVADQCPSEPAPAMTGSPHKVRDEEVNEKVKAANQARLELSGGNSKSSRIIETLLNYNPTASSQSGPRSQSRVRTKRSRAVTSTNLKQLKETGNEEEEEDDEGDAFDDVGSPMCFGQTSKSFALDRSGSDEQAFGENDQGKVEPSAPPPHLGSLARNSVRDQRTLSFQSLSSPSSMGRANGVDLVEQLGMLKMSVLSMRPESRVNLETVTTFQGAQQEVVKLLDLSGVDIACHASLPPKATWHYQSRLENETLELFSTMKPAAKSLLSVLDDDTKNSVARSQGELRYRVDAASTLIGTPTIQSSLFVSSSPGQESPGQSLGRASVNSFPSMRSSSSSDVGQSGDYGGGSVRITGTIPTASSCHGSSRFADNMRLQSSLAVRELLKQTKDSLETLYLRNCGLQAYTLNFIREKGPDKGGVNSCEFITNLDLSDNPWLKSEGCEAVAKSIGKLRQLKVLGMRSTGCGGAGAHWLLRALKYHRVMALDLSSNFLGVPEPGGEKAPIMRSLKNLLKTNFHLTHLDLSWNNIRSDMCTKIGDWLKLNHSVFGLHMLGNSNTTVDARGFLRDRSDLPPFTPSPAAIAQYPHNRMSAPHERCWICGRWSEHTITFDLDLSALLPPEPSTPEPSSQHPRGSVAGGGGGGGRASQRNNRNNGEVRRNGSNSQYRYSSSSSSRAQSTSSAFSSSIRDAVEVDEHIPTLRDTYEDLTVTCHFSFDDPPFLPSAMEEEADPDSDDEFGPGHSGEGDSSHSGVFDGSASQPPRQPVKRQAAAAAATGMREEEEEDDEESSSSSNRFRSMQSTNFGSDWGDDNEEESAVVRFKLNRMIPPGTCQYYFMVYGNGELLLRSNGSDIDPTSPHRSHIGPSKRGPAEVPNYGILVRPDDYAKDLAASSEVPSLGSAPNPLAPDRSGYNRPSKKFQRSPVALPASPALCGPASSPQLPLSPAFSPSCLLTQRHALLLPGCPFHRVEPSNELGQILKEERTTNFATVDIETEEEEVEEEEVVEKEEEWHPRNSVFSPRRFETKGSFYDKEFDEGPEDRMSEGGDNENGEDDDGFGGGGVGVVAENTPEAPDEKHQQDKGKEQKVLFGGNTKCPIELAFDSDAESITKLMKSGLKYSRAFFPSAITDQYIHHALRAPKQSHRHHKDSRHKTLLAMLHAQAEQEAVAKKSTLDMLGLTQSPLAATGADDSDSKVEPDDEGLGDSNNAGLHRKNSRKLQRDESLRDEAEDEDDEDDVLEETEKDPIEALFACLLKHWGLIDSVFHHYAFINNRSPFSMSVHSWITFARASGVDALVGRHNHKEAAHTQAPPSSSPPHRLRKNKGAPPASAEKSLSTNILDKESKSCLEMIFFTATGGLTETASTSSSSSPAAASSSSDPGGRKNKKLPSAIALHYSKHDMTRVEFALALMALARYKQRHMKRSRKNESRTATSSGGGMRSSGVKTDGSGPTLKMVFLDGQLQAVIDPESFEPHSFDEFIYILEVEILGKIQAKSEAKKFNGDRFREIMMYHEDVDNLLRPYEPSLRAIYHKYKLSTMGCGSTFAQLPLNQFVKMMKDCGILGSLVSAQDVALVFLESRIVRPTELVTGDRCLSFVDFLEALVRLSNKIHGVWPVEDTSTGWTAALRRPTFEGGAFALGRKSTGNNSSGSPLTLLERLEEERAKHQAEKDAEREGIWSDPGFAATQRAVKNILELVVLTLRDQDPAGLRYLSEERKRKENESIEDQLQLLQQSKDKKQAEEEDEEAKRHREREAPRAVSSSSVSNREDRSASAAAPPPLLSSMSRKEQNKHAYEQTIAAVASLYENSSSTTASVSSIASRDSFGSSSSLASTTATVVSLPNLDDPKSEFFVAKLEALEAIAEQAIHVHRARTKGQTTAFSMQSLAAAAAASHSPSSNAVLDEPMS